MDPNAHRSRGGRPPGADAYWQRRFFTLIAGLGVIGLLAWAFSGMASGGGKSSHSSGSGGPSSAAYASTAAGTTTQAVSVTTAPASPSPSASPSTSPSASPSVSATKRAPAAASSPARKAAASAPTACPASDLVLTLTASASSYSPGATPSFQLDIVSTGSANCLVDTGSARLKLVVTHGSAVAYNSASCLPAAKRHVVSLRRGVPVVTSMSWNKHQTTSDCSTTVMAAANRTYSAVAQTGGAQSPGATFRLTPAPAASSTKKPAPASTR